MHKEIFKPIEEYENMYEVSNLGRIGSWRKRGGGLSDNMNILNPAMHGGKDYRYLKVGLTHPDGRKTPVRVDKLVADHFLPPRPSESHIIVHRDLDKSNCKANNLVWMTKGEFHEYTQVKNDSVKGIYGTYGEKHKKTMLTEQEVKEIRKKYKSGDHKKKLFQIAKEYNSSVSTISDILLNRTWQHTNNKFMERNTIKNIHRALLDTICRDKIMNNIKVSERDRKIFYDYIKEEISYEHLGARYGITGERVRTILKDCAHKIKQYVVDRL